MKNLSVKQLFNLKKEELGLSIATDLQLMEKPIYDTQVHRPGLALAGYHERFTHKRIQLLGETELCYLQSLPEKVM